MAGHKDFVPKTKKKFYFSTEKSAKYFFIAMKWTCCLGKIKKEKNISVEKSELLYGHC